LKNKEETKKTKIKKQKEQQCRKKSTTMKKQKVKQCRNKTYHNVETKSITIHCGTFCFYIVVRFVSTQKVPQCRSTMYHNLETKRITM
jgi:Flp pilus assembly protein TadB